MISSKLKAVVVSGLTVGASASVASWQGVDWGSVVNDLPGPEATHPLIVVAILSALKFAAGWLTPEKRIPPGAVPGDQEPIV